MSTISLPPAMRIWKYASTAGGLEKNLQLHTSQPLPQPNDKQHLIQVLAVGLNPVDYKPAETPVVGRFAVKKPATPAFDLAGRIITPASGSTLKPGQLVCGVVGNNPIQGGALAEYIVAPPDTICAVPNNISAPDAAGVGVAAVTAHGSLNPYIHAGSRVFINGGSGGVGTYGIQIAKAAGAHVTVSCSARNAKLCRSLGADDVLDYNARPLLDQLCDIAASAAPFDHVVDYVFSDPDLYYKAHTYTTPNAKFVEVAAAPSLAFIQLVLNAKLRPGFLGGGQRKFVAHMAVVTSKNVQEIMNLMTDGKVRTVTDQVFSMEDAVQAFERLKTGRAAGKIIVNVGKDQ